MRKKQKDTIQTKAYKALRQATRELVRKRRQAKDFVVVWQNGKVVKLPAAKA